MATNLESMRPQSWQGIDDIVIVGGGLAGLFCALEARTTSRHGAGGRPDRAGHRPLGRKAVLPPP